MQEPIELIGGKFVVRKREKREIQPVEQKPIERKEYSSEALELRERVMRGNRKLFDAWMQIRELTHDTQRWNDEMEKWHQAHEKLHILCSNLQGLGYEDCLYFDESGKRTKNCISNPDGFWCQVCPSRFSYWEKDAGRLIFTNEEEKK